MKAPGQRRISRRQLLQAGMAAGLGVAGLSAAACSEDEEQASRAVGTVAATAGGPVHQELVPTSDDIFATVEEIVAQGIRRPAYPADQWAEQFCLNRFRDLGLENARLEPVDVTYWEPRRWSLTTWSDADGPASGRDVPCFPLPHSAPAPQGLDGRIELFDPQSPGAAAGNVALFDAAIGHLPYDGIAGLASGTYDPEGTLRGYVQTLPFAAGGQDVMDPVVAAGARALVGSLSGFPGDSHEYYVPYHGVIQPIPGVWISGSEGAALREMMAAGPMRARVTVESDIHAATSNNVIGELAGADDELVIIGSHHDGPWTSGVEDASGIALVLAQAEYWSRLTAEERPHRMIFLLNAGHMVGAAGRRAFIAAHEVDMPRTVLEVHLEHAAREFIEKDGKPAATGQPEPRWWFTTRIPQLESTVLKAIEAEKLTRSLVLPPNAFGPNPPTDGGGFNAIGVPLVSFLAAPFYLFDSTDTLDKVDREGLTPITRATIRIVESMRGETAKSMRDAVKT